MIGDSKEEIVSQLNELIYEGDGSFSLSDIEDIVGDGDLMEYLQGIVRHSSMLLILPRLRAGEGERQITSRVRENKGERYE